MQSYYSQIACTVLLVVLVSSAQSQDERLMGWNKANGLWGKRSAGMVGLSELLRTCSNLNRNDQKIGPSSTLVLSKFKCAPKISTHKSSSSDALNSFLEKRAQWQMANGLWGR